MNRTRSIPNGLKPVVAGGVLLLAALAACEVGQVAEPEASLEIVPDSVTLTHVGERFTFTVRGGGGADAGEVRWSSRDTAVFEVDTNGTVTARGNGVSHVLAWNLKSADGAAVEVRQVAAALEAFGEGQRVAKGLPLLQPVGVLVLDAGGTPVSGVAVRFEPGPGSGRVEPGEVRSDSAGAVAVAWSLGPAPGRQVLMVSAQGGASVEIVATVLEPDEAVASFEIRSGEDQWAWRGRPLVEPIVVGTLDEAGRAVPSASVRFEPKAGSGRADPEVVVSDSLGIASAVWTLGTAQGQQTLVVSTDGGASAEITATVRDPDEAVASFEIRSGEDQWAWRGRPLAEPIVVGTLDEAGRAVPSASVRFEPKAGSGRADPEVVVSDSLGIASAVWTLGTAQGQQTLVVSTDGGASAEITAMAREPDEAVASVEVSSGEDQWALRGRALPDPVWVRVLDEAGRPVWGASVRFEPEAGSGRADPQVAASDSLGMASAAWTLGSALGAQRLVATTAGGSMVVFEATAVSDKGVCNRTPAVSEAIVASLVYYVPVAGCAEVTEEHLKPVEFLYLAGRGIRRLRAGDFAGLPNLRHLPLGRNRLTELPASLFRGLPSLDRLDLGDNQLTELPEDLFAGLPRLERLHLDDNQLRELPPGIFQGLPELDRLVLAGNRLTKLPPGIFAGLSRLEDLLLTANQLEELPPNLFEGLPVLWRVWMGVNRLTTLPPDIFAGLSRLQSLALNTNRLTELPPGVFEGLSSLKGLFLEGNEFESLPADIFAGLSNLELLNLRENRLIRLPAGVLGGLSGLARLELNSNRIEELSPRAFEGLSSLKDLRLEYNRLDSLPRGLFAGLSKLEHVSLRYNPGEPFAVDAELGRADTSDLLAPGPARLVMRVPGGAPYGFRIPLSVQRGTGSGGFLAVEAGDTVSEAAVVVRRAGGESRAVHVTLGVPPGPPAGFEALRVVSGGSMALFAETDNRTPVIRSVIPAHRLQAGGPVAQLALADYFGDLDGDSLVYEVAPGDPDVASGRIEGGTLWLEPGAEDTTEVVVTATDPGGLRAVQRFRTWVVPAPDPEAFNIELIFGPGFTEEAEREIRRAADRWTEAVVGDLPDVPFDGLLEGRCANGDRNPRVVGVIDDVLIRMFMVPRETRVVGSAGRCGVREESGLAFYGGNWFSGAYLSGQFRYTFYETALHEIGHVLGIGAWFSDPKPLLRASDTDPHFAGPLAVAAFNAAGGEGYDGGKVPVEDRIALAKLVHWRKRVIPGDVMTVGFGDNLLTAITVQALADLGHEVDVSKADPYTLPAQAQGDLVAGVAVGDEAEAGEVLFDDVVRGPVVVVDRDGKVVRVIRN